MNKANINQVGITTELSYSNEKLKEMDKLKTNFFANISHEIRTPLTLILSPIESVLQDEYNKEVDKEFAENIHRNAIRLLRLGNNLLDYSKIEEGRMTMNIREIDFIKVVKNYISTVQSAAESNGIDLNFNPSIDSLTLFLDVEKEKK